MHVGVCRFAVLVPHSHSLKDKRAVVRKLRDRVRERFAIGLVEVGGQDTWQRAELAFAVLTGERDAALAAVAAVVGFVADQGLGEVAAVRREVVGYGDDWFAGAEPWHPAAVPGALADAGADADWLPAAWRDEREDGGGGRG